MNPFQKMEQLSKELNFGIEQVPTQHLYILHLLRHKDAIALYELLLEEGFEVSLPQNDVKECREVLWKSAMRVHYEFLSMLQKKLLINIAESKNLKNLTDEFPELSYSQARIIFNDWMSWIAIR
jgi:hypothetical protein